ncbi:7SK snRNA methylphosphate capping enzyme [Fasciola gigantica]|uniref:RNA methyltransferase n=1 Tax=Fasciola gigantica TaxID=46835 RepID=A0A504YST1_FASGI|nr:7SK snRNA methylphosphate capping enzyme [Fasciola gigantica]
MRSVRRRNFPSSDRQLIFRAREICPGRLVPRAFNNWPRITHPTVPLSFPPMDSQRTMFRPQPLDQLTPMRSEPFFRAGGRKARSSWKTGRGSVRYRFRPRKRSRGPKSRAPLNPSDPLNLQDLMKETERRRVQGLSPLRGDSRLNTPALSSAGDMGNESPLSQPIASVSDLKPPSDGTLRPMGKPVAPENRIRFTRSSSHRYPSRRRAHRWRLPITGNYEGYYFRRDPNDRLPYLMPEWFIGKDVADYGCHNGTLTFGVLERFPDVRRIDALDCDAELIANAKSMQKERIRWNTGSVIRYDKINFQVANWIDNTTPTEEPEYDTIMAFSVTKWIHLNYGDAGLMRFFRRAFNLLKPGGHLILEPQPKSSYRKTRFTAKQRSTYQTLKIDPVKLEPLLVDLGFSYFDTIKLPRPNEPFRRKIILCSKSYGATPASIRNDFRSEFQNWNMSPSPRSPGSREPPPVCYYPQTPMYTTETPAGFNDSPAPELRQAFVVPSTETAETSRRDNTTPELLCEPDSTSLP